MGIRVVAKQMAAGVRGRDDFTRSLDPRTTVLLGNRCRRSLGGGEAYHPGHSIGVS